MNSGMKIKELQNQDENISILAAQREMYTQAKRYGNIHTVVSLGIPLVFTVVQLFFQVPFAVIVTVNFIVFIIGSWVGRKPGELSLKAAGMQQTFDAKVYGIHFGNTVDSPKDVRKYAGMYKKRNGDFAELNDWYTVPIEELRAGQAIAACQRQNAAWTSSLFTRFCVTELVLSLAAVSVLIVSIIALQRDPAGLFYLLPVCEWFLRSLNEGMEKTHVARKLNDELQRRDLDVQKEILATQGYIYEYRRAAFSVPDWFYKRSKKRDECKSLS